MQELEKKYGDAIDIVEKVLLKKLKAEEIYQLYGLHKQYMDGNNKEPKPSAFADDKTRLAWVFWLKCTGMTKKQSMTKYIKLVNDFFKKIQ